MKYETFESWMQAVDKEIGNLCGMSNRDLPDVCYGDWYEDGVSPLSAAKRAIRNAGE